MYKSVTKLTNEQKNNIISDFLTKFGNRLKEKRRKKGLSQNDLAYCLDIDRTTLSKYETGNRDMQVSMLPLLSAYCDFPLNELFPKDESKILLDAFARAVAIKVDRKKRQEEMRQKRSAGSAAEPTCQKKQKTLRDQYKDAEKNIECTPYTETEFKSFVIEMKACYIAPIITAGQFLKQIENQPNKETLKVMVADYILDSIVIEGVVTKNPDEASRRAYAYYRKLFHEELSKEPNADI